jgi:spore coat polysaccharide biosynthesis protein SpsF (cytidylyltransferase family)
LYYILDSLEYHFVKRCDSILSGSKFIEDIIITTTIEPEDDAIEKLARSKGISFFRGDSKNIVKRFLDAAEKFNSDIIVRITGDCPLISYEISDYLIDNHLKNRADYTAIDPEQVSAGTYPEIISYSALKRLARYDINFDYSEYLTFYFKNNPDVFLINIASAPQEYRFPEYRLTLDYQEDKEMFNALFKKIREHNLTSSLSNILTVLRKHPEIPQLNSHLTLKYRADKDLIKRINEATKIKL